jgi:glycosyltransferase involved in cell wall biosynthesis
MILISTFNLYKGGSLRIYEEIKDFIKKDEDVYDLTFQSVDRNDRALQIKYPAAICNLVYRIFIDQILIPYAAYKKRCKKIVLMGNVPCLFWFRDQTVFFHNNLYIDEKYISIKNKFEKLYFKILLKLKKPKILVQTEEVKKNILKIFPHSLVQVVGHPMSFLGRSINLDRRERLMLFYPAGDYPHKNHDFIFKNLRRIRETGIGLLLTIQKPEGILSGDDDFIQYLDEIDYDSVQDYYNNCSGLIFLSNSESLGLPLLEACAKSIPIIAPKLNYVDSVVRNLYQYTQDDIDSLITSINELITDMEEKKIKLAISDLMRSPEEFYKSLKC